MEEPGAIDRSSKGTERGAWWFWLARSSSVGPGRGSGGTACSRRRGQIRGGLVGWVSVSVEARTSGVDLGSGRPWAVGCRDLQFPCVFLGAWRVSVSPPGCPDYIEEVARFRRYAALNPPQVGQD